MFRPFHWYIIFTVLLVLTINFLYLNLYCAYPTNKWLKYNPESVLKKETHKLLRDFEIQTDHLISARRPELVNVNKKKRTCRIVGFDVLADHRVKIKECEKRDKYLNLSRKLKNNKVTVIPIVSGALGTNPKGLVKELEDLEIRGQEDITRL